MRNLLLSVSHNEEIERRNHTFTMATPLETKRREITANSNRYNCVKQCFIEVVKIAKTVVEAIGQILVWAQTGPWWFWSAAALNEFVIVAIIVSFFFSVSHSAELRRPLRTLVTQNFNFYHRPALCLTCVFVVVAAKTSIRRFSPARNG
mmetsp:Transcript_18046/g.25973  ORF Transcript_18046/g.25973 Transcript_18046/m.25973 type:complete len:149 (+) Transcript_18046:487-933(+)